MYQRSPSLVFDRKNSLWRNLLCCVPFFGKGSPDLAYDLSKFKSHATLRNNPSYIVGDKLGVQVPDFVPGSSQNGKIPRGIFTWDGIVTLHFWFYLDTFPGGDTGLFDNQWGNDNAGGFQILIQGSSGNMVSYAGDLTGRQSVGNGGLSTGVWYCYILEADAINDTLTVWINNQQAAQNTGFTKNTVDGGTTNAGSYRFFANSQENNYLDGKGFNVMLWDRRLTPFERAFLYSRPFGMYLPNRMLTLGYVPLTITPISVSDSGSGSEIASVLSLISLAESSLGWDAIAPLLMLELFNSISGWDQDQGTWQVTNGELDPVTQNANNWGGMVITKNVSYKDFDAYMRIKVPTTNKGVQFIFRTGSTEGSGYGLQLRLNDGNFRIENWGVANLHNVSFSYTNGVYYRVRLKVRGSNIKAKIWLDDTTEPTTWSIDFDDTTFPNSGKVGFSSEDTVDWFVDWLIIESYDANILGSIPMSDTGIGTDTLSLLAQIALSDSGTGSEVLDILAQIVVSDSTGSTEALSILVQIALSDSANASEVLAILNSFLISDSGIESEELSVHVPITITDAGTLSLEAVNIPVQVVQSDAAVATEALGVLVDLAVADSGTGSEIVSVLVNLAVSDSGIGIDIVSILAQIVLSDHGNGEEAITILAQLAIDDSAVGSEALIVLTRVALSDTMLSSEALSILTNFVINDFGIASDVASILYMISVSDSGVASEVASILLMNGLYIKPKQLSDRGVNLYNRATTDLYNKK